MKPSRFMAATAMATICLGVGLEARGQVAAPAAAAPTMTLWRFLGIPQGFSRVYDARVNRRGNTPGLERKPPLKGIADPENLESPNSQIKRAAEIKQQEDLAKQKIKAIKYLAKIGCGCYPGVKEELMKALDDCTEKVRYEAAKAIGEAACNNCETCNKACCCDEELSLKLAEVAYEMDDECCYKERSARVREAAREALMCCCRGGRGDEPSPIQPGGETPDIPSETPDVPTETPLDLPRGEGDADPPPTPPDQPGVDDADPSAVFGPSNAPITVITDEAGNSLVGPTIIVQEHSALRHPVSVIRTTPRTQTRPSASAPMASSRHPSSRRTAQHATEAAGRPTSTLAQNAGATDRGLRLVPIQADDLSALQQGQHLAVADRTNDRVGAVAHVDLASHVDELNQVLVTDSPRTAQQPSQSARAKPTRGTVVHVDLNKRTVDLSFEKGWKPAAGSWVLVYHQFLLERACLGALEVVGTRGNHIIARPTSDVNLADLTKGDDVVSR